MDKEMEKRGIGGIDKKNMIDKKKDIVIEKNIAYADDTILLAKNKIPLKDIIDTLTKFLKERKLELYTEKKQK